jgi:hypothetical protein
VIAGSGRLCKEISMSDIYFTLIMSGIFAILGEVGQGMYSKVWAYTCAIGLLGLAVYKLIVN